MHEAYDEAIAYWLKASEHKHLSCGKLTESLWVEKSSAQKC
jgi:hypothetical protein